MTAARPASTRWVLVTLSLGGLTVALDASILVVCLPHLGAVFGADACAISWVNITYLIASQSLMLTLASFGDSRGRKRVYVAGLAFYTLGLALCALSQSLPLLLVGRAVQGIGAATTFSMSIAIAVAAFPAAERGSALGILTSVGSVGLVAGPIVGGLLLDFGGWRAIFYSRIPVALVALSLGWLLLQEQEKVDTRFELDVKGSLSLFGFLSSFLLFLNLGGRFGLTRVYVPLLGCLAALFFVAFVAVERRAARPMLDLSLFRKRLFAFSTLSAGLQPACTASAIFLAPFYLTQGLGYSGTAVGVFMTLLALPHVVFAPLSGRLSDRLGPRIPASFAMGLACFALITLGRLGGQPSRLAVGVALLLVGASIGIFLPPNNSAIMGSVPADALGAASAVLSTARQIGSSSGVAIAGALFSNRQARHLGLLLAGGVGSSAKSAAAVASFSDTLLVGVAIGALGLLASSMRGSD